MNTTTIDLFKLVSEQPVIFATYGTLKKGFHNHRYVDDPAVEYLGETHTEPKYTMVGKGAGFPGVIPKGNTSIHLELYKTSNARVVDNICRLEGCTGIMGHPNNWYDLEPVETEYGTAYMFVWRNKYVNPDLVIESGKWTRQY